MTLLGSRELRPPRPGPAVMCPCPRCTLTRPDPSEASVQALGSGFGRPASALCHDRCSDGHLWEDWGPRAGARVVLGKGQSFQRRLPEGPASDFPVKFKPDSEAQGRGLRFPALSGAGPGAQ